MICETNLETLALGLSTPDCPPEDTHKYASMVHIENWDNLNKRVHWIVSRMEQLTHHKGYVKNFKQKPW